MPLIAVVISNGQRIPLHPVEMYYGITLAAVLDGGTDEWAYKFRKGRRMEDLGNPVRLVINHEWLDAIDVMGPMLPFHVENSVNYLFKREYHITLEGYEMSFRIMPGMRLSLTRLCHVYLHDTKQGINKHTAR